MNVTASEKKRRLLCLAFSDFVAVYKNKVKEKLSRPPIPVGVERSFGSNLASLSEVGGRCLWVTWAGLGSLQGGDLDVGGSSLQFSSSVPSPFLDEHLTLKTCCISSHYSQKGQQTARPFLSSLTLERLEVSHLFRFRLCS